MDPGRPEFVEGTTAVRTVAENRPVGFELGDPVVATDPDGDSLVYTLGGADAGSFEIDPSSGQISTRTVLDYESRSVYRVTVSVSDGNRISGQQRADRDDSIAVTIRVTDHNESGAVALSALTPRVGVPLEAAAADPDGDISSIAWQWERSVDSQTWTPVVGATGAVYTPVQADAGHHLRAAASYTDRHGSARAVSAAAPAVTDGVATGFDDVADQGTHLPAITALAEQGIFVDTECADGGFCPRQPIHRWTMAVWLIRILDDPAPVIGLARFLDTDAGQWWLRYVEALANADITLGCRTDPPAYCPDQPVTRAQMASFLHRATALPRTPDTGTNPPPTNEQP